MLNFRQSMDKHSRDIIRDNGEMLGFLQWHEDRLPRVVPRLLSITAFEMLECLKELKKICPDRVPYLRLL